MRYGCDRADQEENLQAFCSIHGLLLSDNEVTNTTVKSFVDDTSTTILHSTQEFQMEKHYSVRNLYLNPLRWNVSEKKNSQRK